jgi:hypothetical protein
MERDAAAVVASGGVLLIGGKIAQQCLPII